MCLGIEVAVDPERRLELGLLVGVENVATTLREPGEHLVVDRVEEKHGVVRRARGGEIEPGGSKVSPVRSGQVTQSTMMMVGVIN